MILRRSFISELANSAGGVFTVLFSIILTVGLVTILNATAGGRYDTTEVFEILVYTSLINLPQLLAASLFIAVLVVMIRIWQDNEMAVWFCSGGQNLLSWAVPVIKFAVPLVVLVGVLSVSVSPWAKGQIQKTAREFQQRDDVSRMAPGRFIETNGGRRVFFIESIDKGGTRAKNIFMSELGKNGQEVIVRAKSGEVRTNALGDRYVVLSNGKRYETGGSKNRAAWRVVDFKRYELRLDMKVDTMVAVSDYDKIPIAYLWRIKNPQASAQIMWRLSWPIATLLLMLLAIPLSYTNTRSGRNINLVIAVLVFILYMNAINIGQAWVRTGRMTWPMALVSINGAFLLLTVVLFVRRVWMQRWLPLWLTELPYRMVGR